MTTPSAQPYWLLALDPSGTRTGWAVLTLDGGLVEAGVLTPDKTRDSAAFRIRAMCRDLHELFGQIEPTIVVIEMTSGHVGQNRHKGAGAGLATYGVAIGALWRETEAWTRHLPAERQARTMVELIEENRWTRGVPKSDRQKAVAAKFPEYSAGQNRGGDIGDAIGLGAWWLRENWAKMFKEES